MHNFAYHRAASLDEAASLLAKSDEASLLAGGQTLIPTLKPRLLAPSDIIDISAIKDLRFIRQEGDRLIIGAATPYAEIAASDVVKAFCPALALLAGEIGDAAVRHRGTIGGSVANNDPAADLPAACLALNAEIITQKHSFKADDFFTGLLKLASRKMKSSKKSPSQRPSAPLMSNFRSPLRAMRSSACSLLSSMAKPASP